MGIEPTRPAWKAGVLPLNYTRIRCLQYLLSGGGSRIRTCVHIRGQIYSLLPLTTRPSLQIILKISYPLASELIDFGGLCQRPKNIFCKKVCIICKNVAGEPGFEPELPGPEPRVLPLNYSPKSGLYKRYHAKYEK